MFKSLIGALADVAQLVGESSHSWGIAGSIPSQSTYLSYRSIPCSRRDPRSGHVQEATDWCLSRIDVCLSPFKYSNILPIFKLSFFSPYK